MRLFLRTREVRPREASRHRGVVVVADSNEHAHIIVLSYCSRSPSLSPSFSPSRSPSLSPSWSPSLSPSISPTHAILVPVRGSFLLHNVSASQFDADPALEEALEAALAGVMDGVTPDDVEITQLCSPSYDHPAVFTML